MSSTQNSKDESLSLVSKFILAGNVLSLDVGVHCLVKKLLNLPYPKNQVQACYLTVVVVSMESVLPTSPFSNFVQPPFPVSSNTHPHCFFCCLVSLAELVIAPQLMCYFT